METQRIDLSQPEEARQWAAQLGVSVDRLMHGVAEVGNELDKLKMWLASPAAARQPTGHPTR